ncbi:MAG: ATP-binding protein [Candidatus Symbiothrix sp.]|jgi:AAA15 family ATPase/GTPase|nr:ATP-binding protein [Candidatus Symbiothrix sp.]
MLLQFSIKNFRTFKEKASLSFVASNYDKGTRELDNIFHDTQFNLRLLKSAVVYGANASGKSKLFDALMFMKHFVINSSDESLVIKKMYLEPFRLNSESANSPSEFEVVFTHKNVMYRYGFEINKDKIISEWLYYKPKTKEIELFYRDGNKFETHDRNFSKGKLVINEGLVRENALLLFVASQFNDSTSMAVIDWFQELNIISGLEEGEFKNNTIGKIKNNKEKTKIIEFLKVADLGIQDIQYEKLSLGISDDLNEFYDQILDIDPEIFSDVSTIHNIYDSNKKNIGRVKFSVKSDESSGTKKFLYLSGTIIDVLKTGGILIADELDSKLHPNLVCKIVSLFNSKLNNKNAQLIFNTQNTNLLSSGLFRRDQIWFTEKNKLGEAKLYSLADFKSDEVRKTESFEENYIRGKYGAVPFLGFFDNLNNILLPYENEGQKD